MPSGRDAAPAAKAQGAPHRLTADGDGLYRASSTVGRGAGWGIGLRYSPLQAATPAALPSDGMAAGDTAVAASGTTDARTAAALSRHEEQGYEFGSPQAHRSEETSPLGGAAAAGRVEGAHADWHGARQPEHTRPWAATEISRAITDDGRSAHADGPGRWLLAGEYDSASHPGTPQGAPAAAEAPAPAHSHETTAVGVPDELTRALYRLRAAGVAAAAPVRVGDSAGHRPGEDTLAQRYGHDEETSAHLTQQVRQEVNSWGVLGTVATGAESIEDAALRAAMEAVQRLSAAMRGV
jgi:hypothetical protein